MAQEHQRLVFNSGAIIFQEGEPGECAYLIESGEVEISIQKDGTQTNIALLGPGDLFGELALIDNKSRTASARAASDTELTVINRDFFDRVLEGIDPTIKYVLRLIIKRFRSHQDSLISPAESGEVQLETRPVDDDFSSAHELAIDRIRLFNELKSAIDNEEFQLVYQPINRLEDGQIVGFESLIRWHNPQKGIIPPIKFIGLAEQTELIIPLGAWILKEASEALQRLQKQLPEKFSRDSRFSFISINLSAIQLKDMEQVDRVIQILSDSGVDENYVKLEITESLLMADAELASAALKKFKDYGVTLAIDDFGTGYSSLNSLHQFPLDTLKIDRSFVVNMLKDPQSHKIVKSIIRLAQELEMDIVAEGVEGHHEVKELLNMGCHYAQGYLISKPIPEADAIQFLATYEGW
ncbi:MAG: EAL domain-containing protein [Gammaproteobacteria bacterium]|nr:MAG: EAL domain-containing protein [Gammaproteobacteria bacterium]